MSAKRKKKPARGKLRAVSKTKKLRTKSRVAKRRGREVYTVNIPRNATLTEIEDLVADIDTKKFAGQEVVKIILLSSDENGKDVQAVSHFYKEITDPFEMNLAVLDILYDVYYTPRKRRTRSEEEVARHKPIRIMFDFESVKNPGSLL
jgi:hypothetical protein